MTALAVMIALVGAMFTSLGSVSAAVGDLSSAVGFCVADNDTNDGNVFNDAAGDSVTYQMDNDGTEEATDLTCDDADEGRWYRLTPVKGEMPRRDPVNPAVTVDVGDTDSIVPDDSTLMVTVRLSNFAPEASVTLEWIRVSGTLDGVEVTGTAPNDEAPTVGDDGKATYETHEVPIPAGTSPGEYTISAKVSWGAGTAARTITQKKVIEVGDAGTNIASARLTVSDAQAENPLTVATESKAGSDTVGRSDSVWLKLESLNSNDEASNNSTSKDSITVIAPGGAIEIFTMGAGPDGNVATGGMQLNGTAAENNSASAKDVTTEGSEVDVKLPVYVRVSSQDKAARAVDVYALVIGSDGATRTEGTVTLTFSGDATSLTLGDTTSVGTSGMTEFSVSASDSAGNKAPIGADALRFSITDADGKSAAATVSAEQGIKGDSTPTDDSDDGRAGDDAVIVTTTKAAAGEYTVTVSLIGVQDSKSSATVVVSGAAANVMLEVDNATPSGEDNFVTATATITDASGHPVVDGTPVTFSASGNNAILDLIEVTDGHKTEDSMVEATFFVVGPGRALVGATAGGGRDAVVVNSTAGMAEEDAMADEEASVACLSNLNGFSTWSCGVESSASEIFDLVSGRGATALHLWNGTAWVRYSVVDGTMVPGSSDFMVAENDILYISN